MKKYLKITIPLAFIGLLTLLGYQIVTKINHKKEVAEYIKTIPTFSFQNLSGEAFTNKDIKKNTPTLFIYFNSECEFCNEETKMIQENSTILKSIQLVFVSFEKTEKIKSFAQNYNLFNYDNIHFVCDTKVTFASTFDVKSLPCLILYDKNQRLIEKIKGQTKVETLLKKLAQAP